MILTPQNFYITIQLLTLEKALVLVAFRSLSPATSACISPATTTYWLTSPQILAFLQSQVDHLSTTCIESSTALILHNAPPLDHLN